MRLPTLSHKSLIFRENFEAIKLSNILYWLPALVVMIPLLIVNTLYKFEVNIFSSNRYNKISKFLHEDYVHEDDTVAITISLQRYFLQRQIKILPDCPKLIKYVPFDRRPRAYHSEQVLLKILINLL